VSWAAIVALAGLTYALKAGGVALSNRDRLPRPVEALVPLMPATLLTALVVVQTFGDGRSLTLDARAAGVAVGALLAWRDAPLLVVVVVAAAVAAGIRAVS